MKKKCQSIILVLCSVSDVYNDIVLNNDTMIHFPVKNTYAQAIIFNSSFHVKQNWSTPPHLSLEIPCVYRGFRG